MVEAKNSKSKTSIQSANEDERLGGPINSGSPVDPTTGEPQEESRGPAGVPDEVSQPKNVGASHEGEHYNVAVGDRGQYIIMPKGWVGPPPLEVPPTRLDDLIKALQGAKKGKSPDTDDEYELTKVGDGQIVAQEKTPHQS